MVLCQVRKNLNIPIVNEYFLLVIVAVTLDWSSTIRPATSDDCKKEQRGYNTMFKWNKIVSSSVKH